MLYLTCTTITSVDLAHYGVSGAKDWVSVDCGTITRWRPGTFRTGGRRISLCVISWGPEIKKSLEQGWGEGSYIF